MLTNNELNQAKVQTDANKLVAEIDRLQKYITDYTASVSQKIDVIEQDMIRLENENTRLISVKESAYVERDACVGLISQLAVANGFNVGVAPGNIVVVDLPAGQVSWDFVESEAHLFSALPAYEAAVEEMSIGEKYRRVMNPAIMI